MTIADLPLVNAGLNGTSAVLLLAGLGFIRSRRVAAHRACMLAALATSTLFLASYLTYHAIVGTTRYAIDGWPRVLYLSVLLTHTVLAVIVPPLAIWTLTRALRGRFAAHRALARWTLPIWIYVSVTGVVIYVMLYPLGGAG